MTNFQPNNPRRFASCYKSSSKCRLRTGLDKKTGVEQAGGARERGRGMAGNRSVLARSAEGVGCWPPASAGSPVGASFSETQTERRRVSLFRRQILHTSSAARPFSGLTLASPPSVDLLPRAFVLRGSMTPVQSPAEAAAFGLFHYGMKRIRPRYYVLSGFCSFVLRLVNLFTSSYVLRSL